MSQTMNMIYENYTKNRATVEKWLAYPRMLQQEYGINPIIAGGAIRDILMGGEVKGINLFISASDIRLALDMSDPDALDGVGEYWDELVYAIAEKEEWRFIRGARAGDHTPYLEIFTFKSEFVEQPYNIIILPEATSSQQLVKHFNFGINQVAVNTYSILAIGSKFIHDAENRVITQCNSQPDDILRKAYDKLCQKYPWPLHSKEGIELVPATPHIILP